MIALTGFGVRALHVLVTSWDQVMIAITGFGAAWVNQDPRGHVRRWACIVGLVGQPFWFYSTFTQEQWGAFAVVASYTVAFMRGLVHFRRLAQTNVASA